MKNKWQEYKERIFHGWHPMRWLRLILGSIVAYESILSGDWMFGAISMVLLWQAILNAGCCSGGACFVPPASKKQNDNKISYEEVK